MVHLSTERSGTHGRSASPVLRWTGATLTVLGALLLVLSLNKTWWGMIMYAPQYPQGLETIATLRTMLGDVHEIDELNHYIGMMRLGDAAKLERALAPSLIYLFAGLAVGSALVARRWAIWVLRIPAITFPFVFLLDLKFWLWYAGNHLDPKAALSSTIKGFTPTMLGEGKIAQFRTVGWVEPGFWIAVAGAAAILIGGLLITRRRSEV